MNFMEILNKGIKEEIQNIIEKQQMQFLTTNKENEINLGFSIPNYDLLMETLGCNDCETPVIDESFGDETYFKLLKMFKTKTENIYFCRIEEYGPGDIDAMKCSIIMTKEIEKKAKTIMQEYQRKSIINEKKRAVSKELDIDR